MDYEKQEELNGQLIECAQKGSINDVIALIEDGGDVNFIDTDGHGALFYATERGDSRFVHLLIDKGADVNQHSDEMNTNTPLANAAMGGNLKIVKMLLKAGGDPYITGTMGLDTLDRAQSCDHPDKDKIIDIITRTVPPKKKRRMR